MARPVLPKPKRRINRGYTSPPPSPAVKQENVTEQSHARQILNLPRDQYDLVLESIRSNIKNEEITIHFMDQGWLTVTEKTFKQYLGAFRRIYADLIRGDNEDDLDSIVSPRKPKLDEEVVLEQLIRVNSRRLKKGIDFELETGIINKDIHKDILATNQLVENLAKLRGKSAGAGRPSQNNQPVTAGAAEQLRKAQIGEAAQDRLASLVGGLIPLIQEKQRAETEG